MDISNRREGLVLFVGDVLFFTVSLWAALFFRNMSIPDDSLFTAHLGPFLPIFAVSILVFYIAGLYEKHTVILKSRLPHIIFRAQIINSISAVIFFYFIPYLVIAPKTSLFIYVVISFIMIVVWRVYLSSFVIIKKSEPAVMIGAGKEMRELADEINKNKTYGMVFVSVMDVETEPIEDIKRKITEMSEKGDISMVVADLEHDKVQAVLPSLYGMIFHKIRFVAMYKVYEDVFHRIPFSILQYNWFLENISATPKLFYDTMKRAVDIILSFIGGVCSLVFYPFVFLAIKLEDKGPVFIVQERIGKGGKKINILKFRSMKTNDRGVWPTENDDRITKVGKFLRGSRIDELPQFWNVLKGDVSLIGPRPDIYDLGKEIQEKIPYYTVRSVISPGLSGWAQISQEFPPHTLEETKLRLAYDLYYVKNRSLVLDTRIILKTIRTLLSRTGK